MWRVGGLMLAVVLGSTLAAPTASATPEGKGTQFYGQAPVWGSCSAMLGDASAIPTAQCGTVSVPVDFTLANGVQGLSTAGSYNSSAGKLAYDVAVTASSISGHLSFTGNGYYTDPSTESGSFSCSAN